MRIAQVLTASTGGIGRRREVVIRLVQRGHAVRIYAPAETSRTHGFDHLGADVLPLSASAGWPVLMSCTPMATKPGRLLLAQARSGVCPWW